MSRSEARGTSVMAEPTMLVQPWGCCTASGLRSADKAESNSGQRAGSVLNKGSVQHGTRWPRRLMMVMTPWFVNRAPVGRAGAGARVSVKLPSSCAARDRIG